jgi:hypothetical protein
MDKKVRYSAKGVVYGYTWGGGEGSYPSKTIEADTLEDLNLQIENGIFDKSLDSGMGYETIAGAIVDITIFTTIVIDGDIYTNKKYDTLYFTKQLTKKQEEFLQQALFAL